MAGSVGAYSPPDAVSEVGVENLSMVQIPTCSGAVLGDPRCSHDAILIQSSAADCWIRNLNMTGFNSYINTAASSSRITIDSVSMHRDHDTNSTSGYPADITIRGTQVLVKDCASYGVGMARTFPVVTQALTPGPNAVVNFRTQLDISSISPHQRWAHGFLVDNSTTGFTLGNRGTFGTGQGWTIGAGVAWNTAGDAIEVSSPPLGTNWCVGCNGTKITGNGTFVASHEAIQPESLFQAQLKARLG